MNKSTLFAVNVDPREGNLRSLTAQQRRRIFPEASLFSAGWAAGTVASPRREQRWPISRWLLAVALTALLAEQVMAWRFRPGLTVLGRLLALLLALFLWDAGAFLSAVSLLAVVLSLGIWWLLRRLDLAPLPNPRRLVGSRRRGR